MKLCVLVIHERDTFRDSLSLLLSKDGHTPICAGTVREAVHVAAIVKPDLIILEIVHSDMGDLETVQRLQRLEETRHLPVIVIADDPDLEYELLQVFDFMTPAVDPARLREDLEMLAEGRKKRAYPFRIEPFTGDTHQLFYDYLVTQSGLHFERRNLKILEKGLTARMSALQIGSFREYYDYLNSNLNNRQELQKLLPFLTVGETYFFRYHAHFDALRKVLATDLANKGSNRIRLWSAGCSTGEEPYSLAMTVMEALPDWREMDIRIIATDINNRSLKQAREGVYGSWSMRVMEADRIDRFFDRRGKTFAVRDDVKQLVDFYHLNLHTSPFPAEDGEIRDLDVIFCRNVMIYFPLPAVRQIVDKFAASLTAGGLLFLGHAETLFQISSRFERHTHCGGFYYRERKGRSAPLDRSVPTVPVTTIQPGVKRMSGVASAAPPELKSPPQAAVRMRTEPIIRNDTVEVESLFSRAEALFEAENFLEAKELLTEVLRRQPGHTGAMVIQGVIAANNGCFPESLEFCRQAKEADDLLPEAYFLNGVVLEMTDREDEAMEEYRKAILLRREFVMPHYFLGRLYFRAGRKSDGARELRNTLKILEKGDGGKVIPFSGGLSREVFIQQVSAELALAA